MDQDSGALSLSCILVLDLPVSGETFSGRKCFVGSRFGDSAHLELFSFIPT